MALLFQVVFLFVMIIILGFLNYNFTKSHESSEYLFYGIENFELFSMKAALSYYLLLNQLIPIALVI